VGAPVDVCDGAADTGESGADWGVAAAAAGAPRLTCLLPLPYPPLPPCPPHHHCPRHIPRDKRHTRPLPLPRPRRHPPLAHGRVRVRVQAPAPPPRRRAAPQHQPQPNARQRCPLPLHPLPVDCTVLHSSARVHRLPPAAAAAVGRATVVAVQRVDTCGRGCVVQVCVCACVCEGAAVACACASPSSPGSLACSCS